MNNKENTTQKRRLSALDVFAIVIVLLCAAGVIVRVYVGADGILSDIGKENKEYTVSFEVTGITSAIGTYLTQGETFYGENGEMIGTIGEGVTVTPAMIFIEDADGKYVQTYSSADNGDASLVDVRGTLTVEGYETEYGFLANGKTYLSPNFETPMHTKSATVTVKITDITASDN